MNHSENKIIPSKAQQAKYSEIVAIVRANPGISIGQINNIYYEGKSSGKYGNRMAGMLLRLCEEKRIKYQEVNRYIAI